MSQAKKCDPITRTAIKMMATICGYADKRIAELLLPVVKEEGLKLGTLQKRIERETEKVNYTDRAAAAKTFNQEMVPAGSYLIHQLGIKHNGKNEHLLIIVELRTGWLHATLMERIRPNVIKATLYRVINEIGQVHKTEIPSPKATIPKYKSMKLPFTQIALITFMKKIRPAKISGKKQVETDTVQESQIVEQATVIDINATNLADAIKKNLKRYDTNVAITKHLLSAEPKDTIIVTGDYSKKQLKEAISDIVKQYNYFDREQNKFPSTKVSITPNLRLFEFLLDKWQKNPHHKKKKPVPNTTPIDAINTDTVTI